MCGTARHGREAWNIQESFIWNIILHKMYREALALVVMIIVTA